MGLTPIHAGSYHIGPGQPVFVIAEAGVNHNGDLELAKRLVDVAAQAGANAIKFQSFKAEQVASPQAEKAAYQKQTTSPGESQLKMLQRLQLSTTMHYELQTYCQRRDILFISSPFDEASADLLDELDVPLFKLPSGEITNWPFIEYVARKGKPLILSTGMSYLSEVDEAVRRIYLAGNRRLVVLHCVSNYPADPGDANLRAMHTLSTALQVPVGYSDHTPGLEVSLAAVALGACVIEKHFTLDKNIPGPDHQASLEPNELHALVSGIRTVERALGNGIKKPVESEADARKLVRRSLVAACDIPAQSSIRPGMLKALRPAQGISPLHLHEIIGRRSRIDIKKGQPLTWSDLA